MLFAKRGAIESPLYVGSWMICTATTNDGLEAPIIIDRMPVSIRFDEARNNPNVASKVLKFSEIGFVLVVHLVQ
jgi:hypothetical protein